MLSESESTIIDGKNFFWVIGGGLLQLPLIEEVSKLRSELSSNAKDKLKKFDGEYFVEEVRLPLAT